MSASIGPRRLPARRAATARVDSSSDEEDASPRMSKLEDVRIMFDTRSPAQVVNALATHTAPDFSLVFIILFVALAYFHETHFAYASVVIGTWLAVQVASSVIKEDFRNDLFWSLFSLIGNFIFYLVLGYCWSLAKLYLDVWQGHLSEELMQRIRTCVSTEGTPGCIMAFLLDMKWDIIKSMTVWPVSLAYTISRDPLRIFTDIAFNWSRQRYVYIISSALQAHDAAATFDAAGTNGNDWQVLVVWLAYVIGYLLIGFLWAHCKLFIDVWQGALPPSLDAEVRSVYAGDQNYWRFVYKIKYLVLQWQITFPLSILYTVLRHPLRILADLIHKLSKRGQVWIIKRAMEARDFKQE